MTGAQVREARRLLGWSADTLGAACNFGGGVILSFEKSGRLAPPLRGAPPLDRHAVIKAALEAAGIEFIEQNGGGSGVRLRS